MKYRNIALFVCQDLHSQFSKHLSPLQWYRRNITRRRDHCSLRGTYLQDALRYTDNFLPSEGARVGPPRRCRVAGNDS
jgi:hypothetical protein